jgi:hypothetical protein
MIDQEMTFTKQEAKEYPLIPANIYQAELVDVFVTKEKKYQSEEYEDKLSFVFGF